MTDAELTLLSYIGDAFVQRPIKFREIEEVSDNRSAEFQQVIDHLRRAAPRTPLTFADVERMEPGPAKSVLMDSIREMLAQGK